MRIVIALGGNALQRRNEPHDARHRRQHLAIAANAVATLARDHEIVVTHGNGPQIGMLALAGATAGRTEPLDELVAESQGLLGYLIERALTEALPGRAIATVLTEVEVDAKDPGFSCPTKPIGPVYSNVEAWKLASRQGWLMVRDGIGFRRAVASPEPRRIHGLTAIKTLSDAGMLVICGGGGGIPIVAQSDGSLRGAEAVIDKDLTAALIAEEIGAQTLLLLTDVAAVSTEWGNPSSPLIAEAPPQELRRLHFAPGSMGPKVEAACRFVEHTGGAAIIGALEDAAALLLGTAGTLVRHGLAPIRYRHA